jgi:hypothetical protein
MHVHRRFLKPRSSGTRDASGCVEVPRTESLLLPGYQAPRGPAKLLLFAMTQTHGAAPARRSHASGLRSGGRDASLRRHDQCLGLQVLPSRPAPVHAGAGFSGIHSCCISNSRVRASLPLVPTLHSRYMQAFQWFTRSSQTYSLQFRSRFGEKRSCDTSHPVAIYSRSTRLDIIANQLPMNLTYLSAIFA